MSGRPKQKVYQYDSKGKYIKTWDCKRDVIREYYPNDKGLRPLLSRNPTETLKRDSTVISLSKIGRIGTLEFLKRKNNPYVDRSAGGGAVSDKGVEVYNLDNDMIASFKDWDIASKMMKIGKGSLWGKIQETSGFDTNGLLFKLKD
tara:strand:+ start:92 stop:529 length:438 start_codon:yes stop_codon:yes gene_type:complete